jgi:phosphonoacetate hydrolase
MQDNSTPQRVTVNSRAYALPQRPVAVICLDGCDPHYLPGGPAAGELPGFARIAQEGFAGEALSALPSFTNPNNCSIVTGAPPSVHGVSGNFYLDRRTGETVMVTGDKELRAPTILAGMAQAGVPAASSPRRTSSGAHSRKACRSGPWVLPSLRRTRMPRG